MLKTRMHSINYQNCSASKNSSLLKKDHPFARSEEASDLSISIRGSVDIHVGVAVGDGVQQHIGGVVHVVAGRIEEEVAESGGTEDVKPHVELASRYTEREPWERGKGGGRDASQHISLRSHGMDVSRDGIAAEPGELPSDVDARVNIHFNDDMSSAI